MKEVLKIVAFAIAIAFLTIARLIQVEIALVLMFLPVIGLGIKIGREPKIV